MNEVAANRNLRAEWTDNPELRRSIQDELRNWASWSFERGNQHGYPSQQPWYTPPRDARDRPPPPPPCNVPEAEETEGHMVLWSRIIKQSCNPHRAHMENLILALKLHYTTKRPAGEKAKIMDVSTRTFWRYLDEAEFRFWAISWA